LPKPEFGRLFFYDTATKEPLKEFFTIRGSKQRPTEIFFDEAQLNVNSREFNKIPAGFIVALSQSRHLHNNLHFIAQDPGMVDLNVRRLVNELVIYKRFWRLMWWYSYDGDMVRRWDSNLPFPKREGFGWYFMTKTIFQCYDSYREFEPTEAYNKPPVWTIEKYLSLRLLKGGEKNESNPNESRVVHIQKG